MLEHENTHTELSALAYRLGLENSDGGPNKLARVLNLIKALAALCRERGDERSILDLLEETLRGIRNWNESNSTRVQGLRAAMEMDGISFNGETLVPFTPDSAAVTPSISILEVALENAGYRVAANHYRQATDNLARGNFESTNGQLRSFLEGLLLALGKCQTNKEFRDPSAVLQHLRQTAVLADDEWSVLRAIWGASQSRGAHQGLSDEEEAQFRLHLATAAGVYLMRKFP